MKLSESLLSTLRDLKGGRTFDKSNAEVLYKMGLAKKNRSVTGGYSITAQGRKEIRD